MSMNEKVPVEVARRRLEVEIEGLTPIEINHVANMVNEKLEEAERRNPNVPDTYKLNIYAMLYLAAELYRVKQTESTNLKALENTLDHIDKTLQQTLAVVGQPASEE